MDTVTWFAFRGSELLVRIENGAAQLLGGAEWSSLALPTSGESHRIGEMEGLISYAVGLAAAAEPPEGWSFLGLRALWGLVDEATWHLAGRAVQIVEWDRSHRFCGRCGTRTAVEAMEMARRCPACGLQQFPRLSPAVIVLVRRGDRVLLARSPHFAPGVYSTLAGFVEPGESLEQAVAREVLEEVGVTLENIRYFGSQPWPFPNSLMLGFTADYAGGDIRPQPGEIEDAGWFSAGDLPRLPSPMSIARKLIEAFLAEQDRRDG
jgi:NAD+ diphosphatase